VTGDAPTNGAGGLDDSFEAVYTRLEETVQRLEEGGLPLNEAIDLYEEGMALATRCRTLLEGAELRVTTLSEAFKGE
jgi:exodeoxyribonuclease VII small subunit